MEVWGMDETVDAKYSIYSLALITCLGIDKRNPFV